MCFLSSIFWSSENTLDCRLKRYVSFFLFLVSWLEVLQEFWLSDMVGRKDLWLVEAISNNCGSGSWYALVFACYKIQYGLIRCKMFAIAVCWFRLPMSLVGYYLLPVPRVLYPTNCMGFRNQWMVEIYPIWLEY